VADGPETNLTASAQATTHQGADNLQEDTAIPLLHIVDATAARVAPTNLTPSLSRRRTVCGRHEDGWIRTGSGDGH
jgi:hypothetical protein